ncbi:MAG: chalcone isomerase family protein [Pseudomonadota bacterium]
MRKFIVSILVAFLPPSFASADISIAEYYIVNAQIVGTGRLSVLFWDVYDAALYAPDGKWSSKTPYALSLSYLRDLSSNEIAERSVQEMRDQGLDDETTLGEWLQKMRALFPDVEKNTILTGVRDENGHTIFYHDDKHIGSITDIAFADRFFGIWLKETTSEPRLRKKLLGIIE